MTVEGRVFCLATSVTRRTQSLDGRGACLRGIHTDPKEMACQPSSLISAIHRNLPYFTANPFEGVNLTNATFTAENILNDVVVM